MKPIVCCERERPDGAAAWEAIGAAFARAPAPGPIEPPARPERRRLWQLPEKHLCVLLGAAFDARELVHASAALARWTQGDEARIWEERFRTLEAERDAARRQTADAHRDLATLRRQTQRDERQRTPVPCPALPSAPAPIERRCAAPADLTAKRLLCVGGKTRLVPQYRAAVESANGVFLYHDGGVEDHLSRLPAMLRSADAVVCLAGDVSHCAYYAVKRYCKRFGKACTLLANSSVSALSHGLQQVA